VTAALIVTNARVLTMDAGRQHAEAVALRGNRIMAVGSAADVMALRGPATRVVDDSHPLLRRHVGQRRLDRPSIGIRSVAQPQAAAARTTPSTRPRPTANRDLGP